MTVLHMDCLDGMRMFPDASFDAVVTDPPYGIRFMGRAWDGADIEARAAYRRGQASHAPNAGPNGGHKSIAAEAGKYDKTLTAAIAFQEFSEEWGREALRVLKPGGHLICFASPRTYHRMVCGLEDAGFEVRDCIQWLFGSGFPKSLNLDGDREGWGTALKPAHEPIVVARRPLIGTVAANVLAHGTGALNIDGCRVGYASTGDAAAAAAAEIRSKQVDRNFEGWGMAAQSLTADTYLAGSAGLGRWPANVIHDGSPEVVAAFPAAPGQLRAVGPQHGAKSSVNTFGDYGPRDQFEPRQDAGSAARFFYCAKASKRDRDEGLTDRTPGTCSDGPAVAADNAYQRGTTLRKNTHPTVKPTELMRYLCRLVTPPGGTVLDPFAGSGSTGKAAVLEGFHFIGFEREQEYVEIANARINAARAP